MDTADKTVVALVATGTAVFAGYAIATLHPKAIAFQKKRAAEKAQREAIEKLSGTTTLFIPTIRL